VAALGALPRAGDEPTLYALLGLGYPPPEIRDGRPERAPPPLVLSDEIRGDLHAHTTWSDGKSSVLEMGTAARERFPLRKNLSCQGNCRI
jgi:DNA polymerase (family 10)